MSAPASASTSHPAGTPPSPVLLFQTINAFQQTAALRAGIELDVFTPLADGPLTAAELASRCRTAERGMRILADHLVIIGFLLKSGDRYSLTPDSAVFLSRKSPAYAGGAAEFLTSQPIQDAFQQLTEAVRKGGTAGTQEGTLAPEHPVWLHFARGMGALMQPVAAALAELLPLDPARESRLLDVSASHGVYGIAAARRFPKARIAALDWKPILEVALEHARAAGIADRYELIPGSAFEADLHGPYDAILIPNFLHHFNPEECIRFLRRVHAALRPGGTVAIVEFVPNDDHVTPHASAGFSIVMLATTPEGDAYTFAQYQEMLRAAGFGGATAHPLKPSASTAVLATR